MFQVLEVGPFLIWSGLVFTLMGIWFAGEFLLRLAASANLNLQHFRDNALWYALAFALGGRLVSILAEYKVYLREPIRMIMINDGGFNFLGGAIGIGAVLWYVTRGHRSIFLQWLDALVPATTLGLAFSWLGAFFSGEAYGRPTDLFWGVTYDASNIGYVIPLHPVQIYYALFFSLLTFVLLVIRKRANRVGAETLTGIVTASVATFLLENFRGDFTIPVTATKVDFILIGSLFLSLGVFAAIELRISLKAIILYFSALSAICLGYLYMRSSLDLETYDFRVSQLLAVLALLITIVYVVVQRRKHPYF